MGATSTAPDPSWARGVHRSRYTAWDGTQEVRLSADRILEKLSEFLGATEDLQQALDWLMRQGAEWDDQKLAGLDQVLEELREEMRKRYRDVNLDHALDEVREKVDEVARQRHGKGPNEPGAENDGALGRLPPKTSEAIERLKERGVDDPGAAETLRQLVDAQRDIRDLEEFRRRYGDLFQGKTSLGYAEAVELMREMERLKRLEEDLFSGNIQKLDLEALRELLGEPAWRQVETLQRVLSTIQESGYVTSETGAARLTPRGVRKIGELALREIYDSLLVDRLGGHATDRRGWVEPRPGETHAYAYGDPMHLDLVGTLKNAVRRSPRLPLELRPDDFQVYDTDATTTSSTVLLLDMSWSMSWEGRFAAAKKVALALETLVRTRYPRDYLGMVGFFTRAVELQLKDLPEASWNMGDPFTNLQDGLRLASEMLARHPSKNAHMIVITDGQPTAYFSKGRLYCEWPLSFGGISMRAATETLKEVERVTRRGITINTFMLDDSPALRSFVEQMTKVNCGRALYTRPDHLGEYLLVDYIGHRKKRV